MNIIDTFLFFNEYDLLELRLKTLYSTVDYFVIIEYDSTFSGKSKEFNLELNKSRYQKYWDKVKYFKFSMSQKNVDLWDINDYRKTNINAFYSHKHNGNKILSQLSNAFKWEVYQRDSIILGLKLIATNNDIILINDLDEIPDPCILKNVINLLPNNSHLNLEMKWFLHDIKYLLDKNWYGTRICRFDYLNNKSIDLMRYHLEDPNLQVGPIIKNGGWHFSSFGRGDLILDKMKAYDYQGRKLRILLKLLDFIFPNRISIQISKGVNIFNPGRKLSECNPNLVLPKYIIDFFENVNH